MSLLNDLVRSSTGQPKILDAESITKSRCLHLKVGSQHAPGGACRSLKKKRKTKIKKKKIHKGKLTKMYAGQVTKIHEKAALLCICGFLVQSY